MSWLEQLRRRRDDRGLMAALRCSLVESRKHRAWPALHRLELRVDDRTAAVVAGLFATHPKETNSGNLGTTCNALQQARDSGVQKEGESRVTPIERRFLHLLAAERGEELNQRVIRIVLLAKAHEVPLNYIQLEKDLRHWDERTRQKWASAFWIPHLESTTETSPVEVAP